MSRMTPVWNALIRTHHITSRKKVKQLQKAAGDSGVFVLLRSGGAPGIIYVQGTQEAVARWVSVVQVRPSRCGIPSGCLQLKLGASCLYQIQRLRYKDYHLASRPSIASIEVESKTPQSVETGLFETGSVKDFGIRMQQRGLLSWWRRAMGYERPEEGP